MSAPAVRHDTEGRRFVLARDGAEVTMTYREVDGSTVDFVSTFTPPELRGKGLARVVVDAALEWARAENKKVIPTCWYVKKILDSEGRSA